MKYIFARSVTAISVLAVGASLTACSTAHPSIRNHHHRKPPQWSRRKPSRKHNFVAHPHIMVIVMENQSYSDVVGNTSMPYLGSLLDEYASATNSYARAHPSLPNYLELISGNAYLSEGTGNDCSPNDCRTIAGSNLADQLQSAHIPWRAFMEGMPSVCDMADSSAANGYVVRHDPFVYFPQIVNGAECKNVVPATALLPSLQLKNPPDFIFLSPSVCNDGGDDATCSTLARADQYLQRVIPLILHTQWYKDHGSIILTWDEGTSAAGTPSEVGGQILTVVVSASSQGQAPFAGYIDTAGILRTIERSYRLSYLGQAASVSSGTLPYVS